MSAEGKVMSQWRVKVSRHWTELGSIIIEAESEDDAREQAMEALLTGDDEIEWESENMEPGEQYIEQINLF